jgi:nitroreductase
MDAIYTRRSIRKFTAQPVSDALITGFIKAGMNAPSAGNQQPWQFMVITDRRILDEIMTVHPHSSMLAKASAAILVCGDLSLETRQGYWVQDCAACTENILLEIADAGLGAVWLGVHPREDRVAGIRRILGIPEGVVPFSLIPVGYPAEEKEPNDRFLPERIHRNGWGVK